MTGIWTQDLEPSALAIVLFRYSCEQPYYKYTDDLGETRIHSPPATMEASMSRSHGQG